MYQIPRPKIGPGLAATGAMAVSMKLAAALVLVLAGVLLLRWASVRRPGRTG